MSADSEYSRFLDELLPELELSLSKREDAEAALERLRLYYAALPAPGQEPRQEPGRVAVIALDPWRDWSAEVKSAVLVADLVICDDPLLYVQDHIRRFAHFYRRTFGRRTGTRLLAHLATQLERMWDVLPLVRAGFVVFRPLRMAAEETVTAVERAVTDHLGDHLEMLGYDVYSYPQWVEYRLPLLAEHAKIELDRELWTEFGMGPAEIARFTVEPRLTLQSLTTWNGLLHAEAVDGTFWSTSDAYWRLARDAMNGLHPGTRLLSFVDTFTRPVLEQVPTRDLLAIRGNDEAFDAFRRHLALSEDLIGSDPDEEQFPADVARVFDEVFRPNIRVIEKAMRRNTLLRDLPFVLATAGFAVVGGMAGAAPPAATIFGALSSLLGFGPAVRDSLRREAKVHQEPAFVFWKLGVPGAS